MLQNDRQKFLRTLFIEYLKMNYLSNKVVNLGKVLKDLRLFYFVISEIQLYESFPNVQFKLNGYEVRTRRDIHKHRGGIIEFDRQGFICKRIRKHGPTGSECICSEFTISKKKCVCFGIYNPPSTGNI